MNKNELDIINNQAKFWNLYAIGSPIALILFVAVLHLLDELFLEILFWVSIIVFGLSSVIWWTWAGVTIYKLTYTLKRADENFSVLLDEIRTIKQNINDSRIR